ncbi:hypothetical protein GJ496_009491 [Pomphorhynchus laevis]|nr:hypothetical protein GJ496_009491 [Pomphorhynchus laevis]
MEDSNKETCISVEDDKFTFDEDQDDASKLTKLTRKIIIGIVIFFSVLLFPISIPMSIRIINQYERAVIFRMGKLTKKPKGPGLFFIMPLLDKAVVVDMRTITLNIPKQEILTRDSVTMEVDAVLFSRAFNPTWTVTRIENIQQSTVLLAATTLRNISASTSLIEFLTNKDQVSKELQNIIDKITDEWGIKIERVEITDVRLPQQMQRAMAAEAEADREAKAKYIAAQGEMRASESLHQAAEIMSRNPAALQLRYLQTLNTISADSNSTIVFPFPMEIMKSFFKS